MSSEPNFSKLLDIIKENMGNLKSSVMGRKIYAKIVRNYPVLK